MDNDFANHVRLIRQQDGVSKNDAKLRAWLEGPEGYAKRKEKEQ